jgi:crossover junction endodeoxyribonuclease RuvC
MVIYGIDPGFSGAIAIYEAGLSWGKMRVYDMPIMKSAKGKTILNLSEILNILQPEDPHHNLAVIEQVGAMPNQGVSSTFRFGQGFGQLQMAIAAQKLPVQYVTPQKWKSHFGLSRDKGVSRSVAMQRFPEIADQFKRVKDDGRAEAALIALYGREKLI